MCIPKVPFSNQYILNFHFYLTFFHKIPESLKRQQFLLLCLFCHNGKVYAILLAYYGYVLIFESKKQFVTVCFYSFHFFFTPPRKRNAVCLSVCVYVSSSACEQNFSRTDEPIWTQF